MWVPSSGISLLSFKNKQQTKFEVPSSSSSELSISCALPMGVAQEVYKLMPRRKPGNVLNILQEIIWLQHEFYTLPDQSTSHPRTTRTWAFTHIACPRECRKTRSNMGKTDSGQEECWSRTLTEASNERIKAAWACTNCSKKPSGIVPTITLL